MSWTLKGGRGKVQKTNRKKGKSRRQQTKGRLEKCRENSGKVPKRTEEQPSYKPPTPCSHWEGERTGLKQVEGLRRGGSLRALKRK